MKKVIKSSPIPIYCQLKEIIQEMIDNEELQPNDPIPTERELCKIHDISRMTVRMAIMSLVNEGVLYREQGKGTFVARKKQKHQLSHLRGFTEDMEKLGHIVDTEILSFDKVNCAKSIAKTIGLSNEQKAIEIKRLRIVDGTPHALETVWLHPNEYPDLKRERLENVSLYDVFQKDYGLKPKYAKQTVEPIHLNTFEKDLFGIEGDSLGLLFNRTTFSDNDVVIEYSKAVYRIDKHKFEIYLEA